MQRIHKMQPNKVTSTMKNAIELLSDAALTYRSMASPNNTITPYAAQENARLAEEFELAIAVLSAPVQDQPEPVDGDLLPPIGSTVEIHLGRSDTWAPHTVTGYYAWSDLGGNKYLNRVFVRVVDGNGFSNSRLLCDVRRAYAEPQADKPAPKVISERDAFEAHWATYENDMPLHRVRAWAAWQEATRQARAKVAPVERQAIPDDKHDAAIRDAVLYWRGKWPNDRSNGVFFAGEYITRWEFEAAPIVPMPKEPT